MFRIAASIVVVLVLALSWLVFGDHSSNSSQSTETISPSQSSQPTADDEALRRSLGGK
jgi:hypothetical protein